MELKNETADTMAADETRADDDLIAADYPFVVPDPCTVLRDALHYTSWTADGGSLPQRGEWSTYRLASKDIILGVMTHRFNATTRCLDVRSYFSGEHPVFDDLEATRGLMAMLLCQAYQMGHSLKIHFEHGVPFDVRVLIERSTGQVISGHATLLTEEVTAPLFIKLSDISDRLERRIAEQGVTVGTVCYHIFRGTWSSFEINALLERGVPLGWLFKKSPDPIGTAAPYAHLLQHLRAVLLEEYALRRLEDRQFGETTRNTISVVEGESTSTYLSETPLRLGGEDGVVQIARNQRFAMLPVLLTTTASLATTVRQCLERVPRTEGVEKVLLVFPMDLVHVSPDSADRCFREMQAANVDWVVVGQTMSQLLSEIEQKLAVTASQADENELDARNMDRHSD